MFVATIGDAAVVVFLLLLLLLLLSGVVAVVIVIAAAVTAAVSLFYNHTFLSNMFPLTFLCRVARV